MPAGLSTRTTHKPQQAGLVFALRVIRCRETDKTRSPSVTPDVLAPLPHVESVKSCWSWNLESFYSSFLSFKVAENAKCLIREL